MAWHLTEQTVSVLGILSVPARTDITMFVKKGRCIAKMLKFQMSSNYEIVFSHLNGPIKTSDL